MEIKIKKKDLNQIVDTILNCSVENLDLDLGFIDWVSYFFLFSKNITDKENKFKLR